MAFAFRSKKKKKILPLMPEKSTVVDSNSFINIKDAKPLDVQLPDINKKNSFVSDVPSAHRDKISVFQALDQYEISVLSARQIVMSEISLKKEPQLDSNKSSPKNDTQQNSFGVMPTPANIKKRFDMIRALIDEIEDLKAGKKPETMVIRIHRKDYDEHGFPKNKSKGKGTDNSYYSLSHKESDKTVTNPTASNSSSKKTMMSPKTTEDRSTVDNLCEIASSDEDDGEEEDIKSLDISSRNNSDKKIDKNQENQPQNEEDNNKIGVDKLKIVHFLPKEARVAKKKKKINNHDAAASSFDKNERKSFAALPSRTSNMNFGGIGEVNESTFNPLVRNPVTIEEYQTNLANSSGIKQTPSNHMNLPPINEDYDHDSIINDDCASLANTPTTLSISNNYIYLRNSRNNSGQDILAQNPLNPLNPANTSSFIARVRRNRTAEDQTDQNPDSNLNVNITSENLPPQNSKKSKIFPIDRLVAKQFYHSLTPSIKNLQKAMEDHPVCEISEIIRLSKCLSFHSEKIGEIVGFTTSEKKNLKIVQEIRAILYKNSQKKSGSSSRSVNNQLNPANGNDEILMNFLKLILEFNDLMKRKKS